mgnify:CR=1 FL=1
MNQTSDDILAPVLAVASRKAYGVPKPPGAIDLYLDGNEGLAAPLDLAEISSPEFAERARRYPSAAVLETKLAIRFGVSPDRVIVTAGGDDALDRACRSMLTLGLEIIIPTPTFEMFPRYAELAGATAITVPWLDGPYPTEAVLARVTERTRVIVVVTPNNPTGLVANAADIRRVAYAAPHALIVVDLAYVEFADEDPTATVLELPNAIAVRTFSKAFGLAGLRVGYALGSARVIGWLRTAGGPYPVSSLSLALAASRLESSAEIMRAFVQQVRAERDQLHAQFEMMGRSSSPGTAQSIKAWKSQGNFVLARLPDAAAAHAALAARGIAVRAYPGKPDLHDCLRITCPGNVAQFTRLRSAISEIFAP